MWRSEKGRGTMKLIRLLAVIGIFGVIMVGQDELDATLANPSCVESSGCASPGACDIVKGTSCEVNGCFGTWACAGDPHHECDYPELGMEVLVCVNWSVT